MADTRRKLKSNQIKIQNLKTAVGVKKLLAYDDDGKIVDGSDLAKVNTFNNGLTELDNNVTLGGEIIQPTELYIRETKDYDLGFTSIKSVISKDNSYYVAGQINGIYTIQKLDSNFNVEFTYGTFNQFPEKIDITDDGKIYATGKFTTYNGVTYNRAIRLNPDGTVDTSFNVGTGFNAGASPFNNAQNMVVKILPDDTVLFGGQFTTYNGTPRGGIIRLNPDGSIYNTDGWGGTGLGVGGSRIVWDFDVQNDGKIVIVGYFGSYNGNPTPTMQIFRINEDGTLDTGFTPPVTPGGYDALVVKVLSTGKIIYGGYLGLLRQLNSDGTPDITFNNGNNLGGTVFTNLSYTYQIEELSTGEVLIAGSQLYRADGTLKRLEKLSTTGIIVEEFDTSFNSGVTRTFTTDDIVLAFGDFTTYDGIPVNDFAEITLDTAELIVVKKGIDVVHEKGLVKYKDNYHDDYDLRTLVDKEYVDISINNIPAETTNLSDDDFYIGYAYEIIEGVETRVEVIHDKTDKDVIITDSGNIVIATNGESKRYILTGQVTELRGVESATDGREIKIKNSGSDPISIIANSASAPVGSRFSSSYTLEPGEEITVKSNSNLWDLSPNNQIAFSDHLDSVNAQVSVGSDGLEVITDIYDRYTGNQVQFKELSGSHTADGIVIISYNGKFFKRTDKEYYIESFGALGIGNDSLVFQKALDGVAQTESKKLIIDGFELILTTTVSSSTDNLTIEFRNGAKISQPTPATNTTWSAQSMRLVLSGNDVTLINFQTDGKFNNLGLSSVPSPVGKFIELNGDNVRLLGKTILKNSGGYNLDVRGDNFYAKNIYIENNAYSGFRLAPGKNIEKFKIGTFRASNDVQQGGRVSGITVNGQVDIQLIEIDTYIGRNANLFTEAVAGDTTIQPYYKFVKVGYYINVFDYENTILSSTMGKMENVEKVHIGRFDVFYKHPTARIQGPQLAQVIDLVIDEVYTNVGGWFPGLNTKIGRLNYNDEGKTWNNSFFKNPSVVRNIVIRDLYTSIPSTSEFLGFAQLATGSKFRVTGDYMYDGIPVPLTIASSNKIKDQIEMPFDTGNIGSAPSLFRQSISFPRKYKSIYSPTNLTRDVVKGELFVFDITDHIIWEVLSSGTCSWSGNTFTGTATFRKTIVNKNYQGSAIINMSNYLTDADVGMTAIIDSVFSTWTTSGWVMVPSTSPINRSGVDITLTRSYVGRFNSFTSSAGNITVPADTFLAGDEIEGQTVGGVKTFVAGAGLTLRGNNLVLSTGQRYSIKFRTATDATLTIYPSSTSTVPNASTAERGIIEQATDDEIKTGIDTERAVDPKGLKDNYLSYSDRTITSSGTIAITPLTYNVRQETIIFTGTAPITLNGFNDAVSNRNLILVNQTGGTITIPASAGVTVPFAAATTIGDGEVSRFMVYNNLILKEV